MYFATGDLLKKDKDGFYYFVDRIGDTFRWKGENVATGEVEGVILKFNAPTVIKEVTVYGVKMPNTLGRAGMANIILHEDQQLDLKQFYDFTNEHLPSYAVPIFLRISKEMKITGTFKHMKAGLREEGFNPSTIKDPLYLRDTHSKTYVPLTEEKFNEIMLSKAKL
eukprot:TRINITY_DN6662_c0_g1_i3.p1 TRINITY_DN6662_c0_g1~~TRINITY_DN6662_c0_g1_i3.p1  ORF type:complete len:166 (-),score=34.98 TRINITY_DN6662_c0_g1_i3:75-572(-)